MKDIVIKPRYFFIIVACLSMGLYIAILLNPTPTIEFSPKLNQLDTQFQSLEQKLSNIDDTLKQLIEQNKSDNLVVKLDSPDEENITTANLKDILKEIIHEELNADAQQNIADNKDTSRAWELISQAQSTEITVDFFQSKEINALPLKQKEMVISKIIGMMNRGEIDADKFFGNK